MSDRTDWTELRERRLAEPGAADAYEAARIAFEAGETLLTLTVRERLARALNIGLEVT